MYQENGIKIPATQSFPKNLQSNEAVDLNYNLNTRRSGPSVNIENKEQLGEHRDGKSRPGMGRAA